jgi:hypothetical protein
VPVVAWWVILQSFSWDLDWQSVFLIGSVGALLLIVAENHRPENRMALPYRFYGVLLTAVSLSLTLALTDYLIGKALERRAAKRRSPDR